MEFPRPPTLADAPDAMFGSGHLWLLELVDGAPIRFQLREDGSIHFGDRIRSYRVEEEWPMAYRHAVRHVRENLDRATLRHAIDDPATVTFFGVATQRRSIAYDWERLPSFLGRDVRTMETDASRPPDATEAIFEQLGLSFLPAFERERHTRDFDPDRYEIPPSHYVDGPAAGVVIWNKSGQQARIENDDVESPGTPDASAQTVDEFVRRHVTRDRIRRIAGGIEKRGRVATFEAVFERTLEDLYRESHHLIVGGTGSIDADAMRSAIAERVGRLLDEA